MSKAVKAEWNIDGIRIVSLSINIWFIIKTEMEIKA